MQSTQNAVRNRIYIDCKVPTFKIYYEMPSTKRIKKRTSDVTTSHSTRLPENDNQVAGYDVIRLSSVMLMAWMSFGCLSPAFPAEVPPESPAESIEQPHMQLAPIRVNPRFGGNLGYISRRSSIGGVKSRSQSLDLTLTTGVDVNTFLWQPWLAQVSGGLNLNATMSDSGYNSGNSSVSSKTASHGVTGSAALDLLPYSRFPFRAHYERADSRQDVGFRSANSQSQSTNYGLLQQYRTLSGETNYSASYDHTSSENAYFGVDTQRRINLSMGTVLTPNQSLTITGNNNYSEHLGSDQYSSSNSVVAHHSYRPGASVTLENLANVGNASYHLAQVSGDEKYTQLSNFTSWASSERPLTVTGSARLANISSSAAAQQSNANASLGASYQLSRHVTTYGNANVSLSDDNQGTQSTSTSESAAANYQSDTTDLWGLRYGTHAGGNLSNSNAPPTPGSTQSMGLSAGHSLNGSSTESGRVRLDSGVDQTVSTSKASRTTPSTSLSHSGYLGWTIAEAAGSTRLRLNASDSRTMSSPRGFTQLVNLQADRNETMTRNSTFTGNLTIQAVRQGTAGAPNSPTSTTSTASANYSHQRVFGVPRLNFSSELRIYGNGLILVSTGAQQQDSRSWSNHLGYSIGRLSMGADAVMSESNHARQYSLVFRLSRVF